MSLFQVSKAGARGKGIEECACVNTGAVEIERCCGLAESKHGVLNFRLGRESWLSR